jgi:hypothetical protein
MKKISIFLLWVVPFLGCNRNQPIEQVAVTELVNPDKAKKTIDDLISLYPSIRFDTLSVYSAQELEDNSKNKFKGTKVDSTYFSFFPKEERGYFYAEPEVFACYKMDLDSSHVGLITRTPSEYVPSSIKLYVVNIKSGTMVETFELAESWGDAGDSMTKDPWLYRNRDNELEWLYWRQDCSYETEDAEIPICSDSLAVFRLDKGRISSVQTKKNQLEKLSKRLAKNYNH